MTKLSAANAARAVFVSHFVAATMMLLVLRQGLPDPSTTPDQRLSYVRENPLAWSLGWVMWQVAALTLVALYAHLAIRWWARSPVLVTVALVCAAAGFGADVGGQSLYMGMAHGLDAEVMAGLITGYAANGLYTIAVALLTVAGAGDLPRRIVAVAIVLCISGFALAFASLAQSILLQQVTAGAMLASVLVWSLLLALWLRERTA